MEEGGVSLDELTLASLLVQAPRKTLMLLVADAGESAGTVAGFPEHSCRFTVCLRLQKYTKAQNLGKLYLILALNNYTRIVTQYINY